MIFLIENSVYISRGSRKVSRGTFTFHNQQKMMFTLQNRANIDPKHNFLQDLTAFLEKETTASNCTPIILGDFNEECKSNTNAIKLCQRFNLVDAWTETNPNHCPISTYNRG